MSERNTIHKLFVRVCHDSGYKLEWTKATRLVADILGMHPISVWAAFPGMDDMERIANGSHPCISLPAYAPYPKDHRHD